MRISVVLSFFNEAENLNELILRLRAVFHSEMTIGRVSFYEIIFVNDASTDESEQLISNELHKGDIKLINMSRNFGVAPCVLAGFAEAQGDQVVYMDSDLQDPPELIHDMINVWDSTPDIDVVNTVRLSRAGEGKIKLFLTRVGYKLLKLTSHVPFLENSGDFKMLSRRVVDHIVARQEALPFIRGLVYWVGFNQKTIFYHRDARNEGITKFNVLGARVIFNFLFSALISFSPVPLIISLISGLAAILVSVFLAVYVFFQFYFASGLTSGWSSIMITLTFFSGVQLFTLGILGLYIYSIHLNVKGRPNYIIKEIKNE